MANIHAFLHVSFEGLGIIEEWIQTNNHTLTTTKWWEESYKNEPFDVLIIMGGPMGVYDETQLSWMAQEKELITKAIQSGKKVLGICLGAQLIADVLGANVYPHSHKEIGWFPIYGEQPFDGLTVFHWHGDTFDLPKNAKLLASSDACKHQAFAVGDSVLGLQFHLEVRKEDVLNMLANEGGNLSKSASINSSDEMIQTTHFYETNKRVLFDLLSDFIR